VDATWANAGNWMPMGVPSSTDEVLFNNAMSNTVSLAAATSVGQIKVSNNTTLILKSLVTASLDLTITGATGDDLVVAAGSNLNITSVSNVVAERIIQIIIPTTVTASISGNMAFSNTGTAKIDHRLLTTDVNSVVFQSGSVFTADLGFGGSPFGSINPVSVTFAGGSRYISKDGGSPFGALISTPAVVVFKLGSTYQHDQTTVPSLESRTYGNFEYTKFVGNQTVLNNRIEGNLIIKNGGSAILNFPGSIDHVNHYPYDSEYNIGGSLIIEGGGNLKLGTDPLSPNRIYVVGNIKVNSGGTVILGTNGSSNFVVLGGNLTVDNGGSLTTAPTGATMLFFKGRIPTITNDNTAGFGLISKLYVESNLYFRSNIEVQDLEFGSFFSPYQQVKIDINNYDLKVTGSIVNASFNNRRIVTDGTGKLKISNVGNTPVLFPISTTHIIGFVTLTNTGTPDEFSVNIRKIYERPQGYDHLNILNFVWNINESTAGGSNVTMTFQLQDDHVFSFVPSNVVLWHGNPNGSFNALPATYVQTPYLGTLTANNVTTFSPFIIANYVALGVTLTNFNGQLTNKNTVLLNWQTENEKDNSGFEIQRSADAKDWSNIGFVKGKGQSSVAFDYTFEDKSPFNLTYYRLKQVDFDGKATYSKVINVLAKKNSSQFTIFPNPTKGKTTTLELNEDMVDGTLTVTNAIGSIVKKQTINSKTLTVDLGTLTNGVYIFDIQKGASRYFEKVMVAE
jgi:hypothetical protein